MRSLFRDPQRKRLYNWENKTVRPIDETTPKTTYTKREFKARATVLVQVPGESYPRRVRKNDVNYWLEKYEGATLAPHWKHKYERVIVSGGLNAHEAQAFADTIMSAWGRLSVPVRIEKRLRNHSYFNYTGIRLAAGWGQCHTVLAHECTHAICERFHKSASDALAFQSHGAEFARVYAIILSRFVSLSPTHPTITFPFDMHEREAAIIASMRANGVNVADHGYPQPLADSYDMECSGEKAATQENIGAR